MILLLTCEHGGNEIPIAYTSYFRHHKKMLKTHLGYDLGALDVFQHLRPLAQYSNYSKTSRLLIELNRSLHHVNLFSKVSKLLSKTQKNLLINSYYLTYRNVVESKIKAFINSGETVLHIGVHSFTPVLNGNERRCDIGLLYDPSKFSESSFCKCFKKEMIKENNLLKVRFNYPYKGTADGFTTSLRKKFSSNYIGIELEINQKFSIDNVIDEKLKQILFSALDNSLTLKPEY